MERRRRPAAWWLRSLRVRSLLVTLGVAGLALALYSREYTFPKLAMIVLPCAGLLGWWLGWRLVLPIERLREQALAQVEAITPGGDLQLRRGDEFGELTGAFNRLLAELRTRAHEKEAFVADLAHEFKNPVAAIRAAAEALADGPRHPERLDRLSQIVDDSSRRLDELVTQFLELARAEAGLIAQERETVDLGELGRRCLHRLRSDERFAGVTFSCATPEQGPKLTAVASGLQTVVENLLENAASFAGATGHVELAIADGERITIEVRDDGPGISAEDRPRVFDRFFTRRASGIGTGLGLAMVRAVIEAHGGTIAARPRPGGGTEMRAVLPR